MIEFNRLFWMILFLLGTTIFAWFEWQSNGNSKMVFFMFTSLWSAFCGIAYTVMHWFIDKRISNVKG
jgi:hypothetical protein